MLVIKTPPAFSQAGAHARAPSACAASPPSSAPALDAPLLPPVAGARAPPSFSSLSPSVPSSAFAIPRAHAWDRGPSSSSVLAPAPLFVAAPRVCALAPAAAPSAAALAFSALVLAAPVLCALPAPALLPSQLPYVAATAANEEVFFFFLGVSIVCVPNEPSQGCDCCFPGASRAVFQAAEHPDEDR